MTAPRLKLSLSLFCFLLAGVVRAEAQSASDPIGAFLAEKGLLSSFSEVEQRGSQKASELVVYAMGFLGVPYRLGGDSLETGFDCSGFVKAIYQQTVGLILPRTADEQAAATRSIEPSDLQPGDLVFFNTQQRAFSHVGIYVGDGKFVHSPKAGAEVRIENMGVAYWESHFDGARRVFAALASAPADASAGGTN